MLNIRAIKECIRRKTWIFLKARWRLRSGLNVIIENDSDWFVYNEIFVNKEYDEALMLFISELEPQPLIIDLGANVGYFTLKIADELIHAGRSNFEIVSLEAAPQNYSVLQKRIKQHLLKGKVTATLGLAGFKSGTHSVVHSEQHYGHSSASGESTGGNTTIVSYVDIEKLLPDTNKKISFLKCDIEGSEEIFIKEYFNLLQRVEMAVFEFHADNCDVDNCRAMLKNVGLHSNGIIKEDQAFKTSVEIFRRR
jgi:FkbM family methyltransferase